LSRGVARKSLRLASTKAAWSLQEGEPDADLMISMAKAWTSDASRRVVAHGQQFHGGIGFTKEYKIQLISAARSGWS